MQMHPLAFAALLATVATAQAQTSSGPTTGTPTTTALPEVKVTDEANSAATEGSGQYTAREVSVGKLQQAPRETPQSLSVVTRQQLERALWGDNPPDGDMLRSHIYELRRSVDGPFPVKLIQTLPRTGYRLAVPHASGDA